MDNDPYLQGFDESILTLTPESNFKLTQQGASIFAGLALKCIQQEFPNKLGHVMDKADDWQNPKMLHPAFYGCYDWHSAVHGHWMLIRLLKLFPTLPEAIQIRQAIGQNLLAENILVETAYFERASAKTYEITYGWAWLLKLTEELSSWENLEARQWAQNLQPLTNLIVQRYLDFLPRQTYPNRTGVHPNTAFGLSFALFGHQYVSCQLLAKELVTEITPQLLEKPRIKTSAAGMVTMRERGIEVDRATINRWVLKYALLSGQADSSTSASD